MSITFGGGFRVFGSSTLYGIAYYDTSSGLLYAIAPDAARTDGILFVGQK